MTFPPLARPYALRAPCWSRNGRRSGYLLSGASHFVIKLNTAKGLRLNTSLPRSERWANESSCEALSPKKRCHSGPMLARSASRQTSEFRQPFQFTVTTAAGRLEGQNILGGTRRQQWRRLRNLGSVVQKLIHQGFAECPSGAFTIYHFRQVKTDVVA